MNSAFWDTILIRSVVLTQIFVNLLANSQQKKSPNLNQIRVVPLSWNGFEVACKNSLRILYPAARTEGLWSKLHLFCTNKFVGGIVVFDLFTLSFTDTELRRRQRYDIESSFTISW